MNEKSLIEQLSAGDTAALARIIKQYSSYVCTIARNISNNTFSNEDIDEVSADVFYKLWLHKENIKPELGLHPYLSAIARNTAKSRLRQQKPPNADISELDLSSDYDVEETAVLNSAGECINEGLNTLPKEDREIFLRHYLYGETTPQIAKAMKISENTIYSKLRRTKAKLREYLTERGYDNV